MAAPALDSGDGARRRVQAEGSNAGSAVPHPGYRATTLLLRRRAPWPRPSSHQFRVTQNSTSFPPSFSNFRIPTETERRSPGQGSLDWTHRPETRAGRARRVGHVGAAGAAARPGRRAPRPRQKAHRPHGAPTASRTHARAPACAAGPVRPRGRPPGRGSPLPALCGSLAAGPRGARRLSGLPRRRHCVSPPLVEYLGETGGIYYRLGARNKGARFPRSR